MSAAHTPAPDLSAVAPAIRDAYRTLESLHKSGWRLHALDYDTDTSTATVTAESPNHRMVTVDWNRGTGQINRRQVNGVAAVFLVKAAHDVAYLGHADHTGPRRGQLDQLRWLAQGLGARRPAPRRRTALLPCLPTERQPSTMCRAAAWLMARLIGDYGWRITAIGEDIAGYGFIAELPGDVAAVYPAGMDDDGTPAAALARLLPLLDQIDDLALLDVLDFRQLWAAGQRRADAA